MDKFIGVVGIEIDYSMMAEQIDSIRLYSNGYAFLSDADGKLFYHPRIDVTKLKENEFPETPQGLVSDSTFFRYEYDGVEKEAAWLPLSNGMRLNVSTPVSEAEGEWQQLFNNILIVAAVALVLSAVFTMFYTKRITKPLKQLTEAAEQVDKGNYDYVLDYDKDDEVGRLTQIFKRLSNNLREHLSDLNNRVFVDALTKVKNKAGFNTASEKLQAELNDPSIRVKFAIAIFDCNDLKNINDRYGHDKGDIYLQTASNAICSVFGHSPVFRIGGDEFAVILRYEDYQNREILSERFEKYKERINAVSENEWDKIDLAVGIAKYDSQKDKSVKDVMRRADAEMYRNKRERHES